MFYEYEEAPDLEAIAEQLKTKFVSFQHIDMEDVLFLWENVAMPKASARCYKLDDHPIGFFTPKIYAIVVYRQKTDYMSHNQLVLLVAHELKHIGLKGGRLRDHNVKDFRSILGIDLDWHAPGADIPNILDEEWVMI